MTGTNTCRGLHQKGRLIDSCGAVSFPALLDKWRDEQLSHNNDNNNTQELNTLRTYVIFLKKGCNEYDL